LNKKSISPKFAFIALSLFLWVFRTAFGLSGNFMDQDHLQTYLIGLKWYGSGGWPFFGPDLVILGTVRAQIPGALEAFLVGGPFFILPIPEAPFLLLNLLSLSGIALLSWYLSKRMKRIPFLFIFAWISLLPWTLNQSTWVLNPSYLLFGSILFFIGVMEAIPQLSIGSIRPSHAFLLMGFGLFWDMQFHFSWILLTPFVPATFILFGRRAGWGQTFWGVFSFILGSLPPLALVLPTLLRFGWHTLLAGGSTAMLFNANHARDVLTVLARYLSLACYEIPQFIGAQSRDRWDFLVHQDPFVFPFGIFLFFVGLIQPVLMLALGWIHPLVLTVKKRLPRTFRPDALAIYLFSFAAFLMIYLSFWFTEKEPVSHIYFVYFPVVTVFSFYIWDRMAEKTFWRKFGRLCLVVSFFFQLGLILHRLPLQSLFLNRAQVVKAIQGKNYQLLGERRAGTIN
jgi:hypothetical protein